MPNGVDLSEFQGSTPGGYDFYLIRTLNENGREDLRWQQHHANTTGRPRGAYGIIRPWNIDPNTWAARFAATLTAGWELVPTIDIELGDPSANRAYASVVVPYLKARGHSVVMGYYSAGSAYRQQCADLFDRQWLAAWGSRFPASANVHQYQGSPLDLDYCPDLNQIRGGQSPGPEEDVTPEEHAWLRNSSLILIQLQEHLTSQYAQDVRASTLEAAQTTATQGYAILEALNKIATKLGA